MKPAARATPPTPGTWTDVFGGLMFYFVGIPLVVGGWLGLIIVVGIGVDTLYNYNSPRARQERTLPSLPATPLRSLVPTPEAASDAVASPPFHDGALVRVEGFLCGDPPIAALASPDRLYALQYLVVTHKYSRFEGETQWPADTITDDEREYYPPLWLNVGPSGADEGRVEVRLPKERVDLVSRAFIKIGKVDLPVAVPEDVARALALAGIPPLRDQEWLLWAVPQNVRVTVLALARQREGRVVLELEGDGFCTVSPKAWKDIAVPPLTVRDILGIAGFCAFFALLPVPWHYWKKFQER